MRRHAAIGWVLGAATIATCAPVGGSLSAHRDDAPATPPSARDDTRDERGDGRGEGRREGREDRDGRDGGERGPPTSGRRGSGENWVDQPPPGPEEWTQIEAFMRENSPARLSMFHKIEAELGPERRATRFVRLRIAARYRDIQKLRERNPEMYEFAFKQLRIEDAALALLGDIRRDGESPELEAKLNGQMRSFVDNALDERAARLAKLKTFLAKEEASIARDRANVDRLVARQRERFEKEMEKMLDFAARVGDGPPATRPANAPT